VREENLSVYNWVFLQINFGLKITTLSKLSSDGIVNDSVLIPEMGKGSGACLN